MYITIITKNGEIHNQIIDKAIGMNVEWPNENVGQSYVVPTSIEIFCEKGTVNIQGGVGTYNGSKLVSVGTAGWSSGPYSIYDIATYMKTAFIAKNSSSNY